MRKAPLGDQRTSTLLATLDHSDFLFLANALRLAQETYLNDARNCRSMNGSIRNLAEQFDKQASDAARLAEFFQELGDS